MNKRRVRTLAMCAVLIVLPCCTQQEIGKDAGGTPIIVGDGSIHIRHTKAPFDRPGNWDKKSDKEYSRKGANLGQVSIVRQTNGDWANKPESIADFHFDAAKVVVKVASEETLTVEFKPRDSSNPNSQVVITSVLGLTSQYQRRDNDGTELIHQTSNNITMIEIYPPGGNNPLAFDQSSSLMMQCRSTKAMCGVSIDVK